MLAVEIEVYDERIETIWRQVDGGGKVAQERGLFDHRVRAGLDLPEFSVGHAVAGGHIQVSTVSRHPKPVRTFGLNLHLADRDRSVDGGAVGTESDEVDEVG